MTRAPNEPSRAASFTPSLRWLGPFYPPAADAEITKASFFRFLAIIDVPKVDQDPAAKRRRNFLQVERSELVPLGHDDERVCTRRRGVRVIRELDSIEHLLGLLASDRVERAYLCAALEQQVDQRNRGRFAHVVGVGLEGEAEHPDALALEVAVERAFDAFDHARLAVVVDLDGGADDALVDA